MQAQLVRKIAHHLAACHTVSLGVECGTIDADARAAVYRCHQPSADAGLGRHADLSGKAA